ncbi:diguanylate cyclase domain-containing protein [Devosia sp.]|uniref:diguanylate cyclase domain-containing protein n=1 Tax=Devosia sp. TaxID=1871048 RepID=UPI003A940D49
MNKIYSTMLSGAGAHKTAAAGKVSPVRNLLSEPFKLVVAAIALMVLMTVTVVAALMMAAGSVDAGALEAEQQRALAALNGRIAAGEPLDRAMARRFDTEIGLKGAHFVRFGPVPQGEAHVAVPGGGGLALAWTPARPGSAAFAAVAPIRIAIAVCFFSLIAFTLVRLFRTARELERQRSAAADLAGRDPLTGLGNRMTFDTTLAALSEAKESFGLLYIDLDGFKAVNDRLGHGAGDKMLCTVGARLRALAGEGDAVTRVGGDEFAMIRRGVADQETLYEVAKDIQIALSAPVTVKGTPVCIGASIGIAMMTEACATPDLVASADEALYRAKAMPEGRIAFATNARPKLVVVSTA